MIKKYLILFITFSFIVSCSSDDNSNSSFLVKKIVSNGNEFVYSYNANKISKIEMFGQRVEYFYTGNLITKVKKYDIVNTLNYEIEYHYSNSNLSYEIIKDFLNGTIEKVEYEYVQNNVISFIRYENDFGTFEEISHGNYYLNNEYEVQVYETFTNSNNLINRFEFTFDTHNNPLKNVVGFSKLFSSLENGLYRNVISRNVYDENNVLIQSYLNQYTYNQNNYPETRETFFNGSNSSSSTSQFYY